MSLYININYVEVEMVFFFLYSKCKIPSDLHKNSFQIYLIKCVIEKHIHMQKDLIKRKAITLVFQV